MNNSVELTILMPCLNEALTIGTCINKATLFLKKHNIVGEVLIADNGSTDSSIEIATQLGARVINVPTKGYGSALLHGIENAYGTYTIMGDSDDSYDFSNLMPFVEQLRNGHELVMGNRFKGGIGKGAMPFLHRYLGNPVLSFIGRLFFNAPINDFHCGLRGFHTAKMRSIGLNTTGMEFASEMIVKSVLNKLRVCEVPTRLQKDGRDRKPHLRTWHDGWRHLRFLMLYSPKWVFLIPGILFLLTGGCISFLLLNKPLHIKGITLDIHTLLYTFAILVIGFQLISFYLISKIYGGLNGLLPQDRTFHFALKTLNLEKGLIAGALIVIAGISLTIKAYHNWRLVSYGNLSPSETLRLVIPAAMLLILGIQLIQNCFFASILNLPLKSKEV